MNKHDSAVERGDFSKKKSTTINKTEKSEKYKEWMEFARKVGDYIEANTIEKYGDTGDSLTVETEPRICVWNILKYSIRMWKNRGKTNDIFKICHYAQMCYDECNGDFTKAGITNEKGT